MRIKDVLIDTRMTYAPTARKVWSAILLLSCGIACQALAETGRNTDGAGAVRETWSNLDEFWNARDAERFAELFTSDTSFHFVDRRETLATRTVVRDYFAERFPRFAPELRHRTEIQDVWPVAPDVRALDGTVEVVRVATGTDAEPEILRTFAIFGLMKQVGVDWRIDVLRVYLIPAAGN